MAEVEIDTLYGINKQLYKKINPNKNNINMQLNALEIWFSALLNNKYFMLLCRERNDYTIFHIKSDYKKAISELREVLESRGTILDMVYSEEFKLYECWIKDYEDEEVFMYAFFPCDDWVINIE